MVIDKDEDSINNIAELVTHTAIVDVTEERDFLNYVQTASGRLSAPWGLNFSVKLHISQK